MKHLKQVIEEGELNDAIKLYLECHETIARIHNHEFVEVPVGDDLKDYEVEEVGEIELDECSKFELVSVRTHIANLRLAYSPECEVITDIVDETEFVEELGIGVFDGNIDDEDDEDFMADINEEAVKKVKKLWIDAFAADGYDIDEDSPEWPMIFETIKVFAATR